MGNMISIGLTGSHSCRYMVRALFFLFFSFYNILGTRIRKTFDSREEQLMLAKGHFCTLIAHKLHQEVYGVSFLFVLF